MARTDGKEVVKWSYDDSYARQKYILYITAIPFEMEINSRYAIMPQMPSPPGILVPFSEE